MALGWFTNLRVLAEVKKTRLAMERIATCLEEALLQQTRPTGTGLRSLYRAGDDVEGQVLNQTDEELAVLEAEWMQRQLEGQGDEDED